MPPFNLYYNNNFIKTVSFSVYNRYSLIVTKMSVCNESLISDDMSVAESFTPFVNDRHAIDDDFSLPQKKNKSKKLLEEMMQLDKGFHVIKKTKDNKKYQVEVYSTSCEPGSTIRCAITGSYFINSRVGKYDEDLFFKVRITHGIQSQNPITLFFDSPDQYERHMKTTISQNEKEKWSSKSMNENAKRK